MRTQTTRSRAVGQAPRGAAGTDRTGPVGRLARLVLAAGLGLSLASVLDQGGRVGFRSPSVLTEPSVWLLDAGMLMVFIYLVGQLATALVGETIVALLLAMALGPPAARSGCGRS